ncbi:hypothetical protein ABBQ38_008293 [Trebouxia sp. C0009 RCD-2024]
MLHRSTAKRQTPGSYSSDEIARMPLAQLRELSDLQLSERELADVIAAIHSGGAQDEHFSSAQCFVCHSDTPTDTVEKQGQLIAQWVSWYKQYKVWASSCQQGQAHAKG